MELTKDKLLKALSWANEKATNGWRITIGSNNSDVADFDYCRPCEISRRLAPRQYYVQIDNGFHGGVLVHEIGRTPAEALYKVFLEGSVNE